MEYGTFVFRGDFVESIKDRVEEWIIYRMMVDFILLHNFKDNCRDGANYEIPEKYAEEIKTLQAGEDFEWFCDNERLKPLVDTFKSWIDVSITKHIESPYTDKIYAKFDVPRGKGTGRNVDHLRVMQVDVEEVHMFASPHKPWALYPLCDRKMKHLVVNTTTYNKLL